MDSLTAIAAIVETVTGAVLTLATAAGLKYEVAPRIVRQIRMRALAAEVRALTLKHALENATHRPPRRRHDAHCPACGRFAHVTSSGPRGTWTRCGEHGLRLRATHRIGRPERNLVLITTYRPLVPTLLTHTSPMAILPPVRMPDWLDAVPTATLRRTLAA